MPKRLTTPEFIKKAIDKHDDTYSYNKVNYKNNREKVCIVCPIHGEFWQAPSNHLKGNGCPACFGNKKIDTQKFIIKSKEVHGDKYIYTKTNYINAQGKVCIICKEHGEFYQKAYSHIAGCGCRKCYSPKFSTEEMISKSREIHGDVYDYKKVDYKSYLERVCIICPHHGEFYQTPRDHIGGCGCQECGKESSWAGARIAPGWRFSSWEESAKKSKSFDGFKLYICELSNKDERFYKVGRTYTTVEKRFAHVPYNYKPVKIIEDNARKICELEAELKTSLQHLRYKPKIKFGGFTECYSKLESHEILS